MRATCTLILIASVLGACAPKKETVTDTGSMVAPVLTGEDAAFGDDEHDDDEGGPYA